MYNTSVTSYRDHTQTVANYAMSLVQNKDTPSDWLTILTIIFIIYDQGEGSNQIRGVGGYAAGR